MAVADAGSLGHPPRPKRPAPFFTPLAALPPQSIACVFPAFKEVTEAPGPHLAEIDEHTPNSRIFRNYAGLVQE